MFWDRGRKRKRQKHEYQHDQAIEKAFDEHGGQAGTHGNVIGLFQYIGTNDFAGAGRIDIVRLASRPAEGRSYELWALGAGRKAPESLGVINARAEIPAKLLGSLDSARLQNTVFAISDEPTGGSPTGQPTGPVLFTGKIVPYSGR